MKIFDTAKRITVSLPPTSVKILDVLTESQEVSQSEAIRRAIANELFILHQVRKGSKILVEDADGKLKELVFINNQC